MNIQRTLPFCLFTLLLAGACTGQKNDDRDKELAELRQLAEMDRREMENQYAEYALQYGEMQKTVHDDSLAARLAEEQQRAERLLAELKSTKASSSAEILRLKRELETVRAVLRDYIRQVDSLQQTNLVLAGERDAARAEAELSRQRNAELTSDNEQLQQTVEVAAQLNAANVSLSPLKKNGKAAKKAKDVKSFSVSFTLSRNVTARTGNRTVSVRLMKPNQTVIEGGGSFTYEGRTLAASATKGVEYGGQDTPVALHISVSEYLSAGTYTIHIFCDGQMIGSGTATLQ